MRLHLRGIVQRSAPTHRGKPLAYCVWRVVDKRKEADSEHRTALAPLVVDAATLTPYTSTLARRGTLPLMLPMFTPYRSGVALMCVVARPPVPLLGVTY